MDDDLPKEGELLDITKKRSNSGSTQSAPAPASESTPSKIPVGLLSVLAVLAIIAFMSKGGLGSKVDPEKLAIYKDSSQSIIATMKTQLPTLVSVQCAGSKPDKADCVNFVGVFRPIKDSPTYISSMGTIDKAPGVTDADIEIIKSNLKVLADSKRTTIAVREPVTFLVDSVTEPKVGEPFSVKIKCTESGVDAVVCESVQK